jgi:hypothetical protein
MTIFSSENREKYKSHKPENPRGLNDKQNKIDFSLINTNNNKSSFIRTPDIQNKSKLTNKIFNIIIGSLVLLIVSNLLIWYFYPKFYFFYCLIEFVLLILETIFVYKIDD